MAVVLALELLFNVMLPALIVPELRKKELSAVTPPEVRLPVPATVIAPAVVTEPRLLKFAPHWAWTAMPEVPLITPVEPTVKRSMFTVVEPV